jgi:hypothetical protein
MGGCTSSDTQDPQKSSKFSENCSPKPGLELGPYGHGTAPSGIIVPIQGLC